MTTRRRGVRGGNEEGSTKRGQQEGSNNMETNRTGPQVQQICGGNKEVTTGRRQQVGGKKEGSTLRRQHEGDSDQFKSPQISGD